MSSKLRLVYTLPFFHPATRFGGPVSQLKIICPQLVKLGAELRVITTDNGLESPEHASIPRDRWISEDGYEIYYASTRPSHRVAPYFTPRIKPALVDVLPDSDFAHMHLGLVFANDMVRRLCNRFGVASVYSARGALCPLRLRYRGLSKAVFVRLVEKKVLRDAALLHALTEKERTDYIAQGADPKKIHVFGDDGIEPIPLANLSDGVSFRLKYKIPQNVPLVLFLSQLMPIKGLDLLIEASARVMARRSHYIVFAGPDAGAREQAEELVNKRGLSDRVRFTGHLHMDEKYDALRACDLFALLSYSEGLPNAPLEAAMCERPVLISDACHIPEVAEFGAGRVVPTTVDAAAEALEELLGMPEEARRQLGANARRMVIQHFKVTRVAEKLMAFYEQQKRQIPV